MNFFQKLWLKISSVFLRIWHVLFFFPKRLIRIFEHFKYGFSQLKKPQRKRKRDLGFWSMELILLFLDLIGFSELYENIQEFLKYNIRPLTNSEKELAIEYFGSHINLDRVRVDEKAFLGPPQHHFAYVSFFTINSWGKLSTDVFLHELVHIWQYEKRGIIYMSRALAAQHGKRGYNYGGIELLRKLKARGRTLASFNPEHQAEIVQDHFRLRQGYRTRRGFASQADLDVYEWFVRDLIPSNKK